MDNKEKIENKKNINKSNTKTNKTTNKETSTKKKVTTKASSSKKKTTTGKKEPAKKKTTTTKVSTTKKKTPSSTKKTKSNKTNMNNLVLNESNITYDITKHDVIENKTIIKDDFNPNNIVLIEPEITYDITKEDITDDINDINETDIPIDEIITNHEPISKRINSNQEKVDNFISDIFEKENKKQIKDSNFHKENIIDQLYNTTKIQNKNELDRIKDNHILKNIKETNKKNDNIISTKKSKINIYLIIIFILLIIISFIFTKSLNNETKKIDNEPIIQKEYITDENILFVGDSTIKDYDIEKHFSYNKTVNNIKKITTNELLKEMNENIYIYNPSKTVLIIGNDDIKENIDYNTTIKNTKQIINEIILNRNLSEIFVVSLFPQNNNQDIKSINKEIKEFCIDKNIMFVDIYNKFINEDNFNEDSLSEIGYELLTNTLIPYINKE